MLLVRGTIVFGDDGSVRDATVRVQLEDVSRIDATAPVVAEQVMRGVGGGVPIEFVLHGGSLDPRARYNVRVHVDVNGDGQVSVGDYVSTRSAAVTAGSVPATVSIAVSRVG
jgi:uncharacterized lipoprotein YbaY